MPSVVYDRIKLLCEQNDISVSRVESILGFGASTIVKWGNSSPSADKLKKVADYFNVSIDYLMGRNDDDIDEDIIQLCRAHKKMTPCDRDQMMKMIRAGYNYAFSEDDKS